MTYNSRTPEYGPELEKVVEKQLSLLKPIDKCWQPTDVLPDLTDPNWQDQVNELRAEAKHLPNEVLIALVGNTVTEEALPTYQTWLNRFPDAKDETGVDAHPWAVWLRAWTAEENRHGDALNRYLYLTGRINMRSFEVTTQYLLSRGFDPKTQNDSNMSLIYVAFQETATQISHFNVGRLAKNHGDSTLSKICKLIAGDEARHGEAYKRIVGRVIELDPIGGLMAFYNMMKRGIAMPAGLMSDGTDRDLYGQYTAVAQRIGVYTVQDYANVIRHLVSFWKIPGIQHLSGQAAKAQDYLCGLADRFERKADIFKQMVDDYTPEAFQWLFEGAEHQMITPNSQV